MPPNSVRYQPEHCALVIAMGLEGKSVAMIASKIGCNKKSIYHWRDKHEEFAEAFHLARTHCQAWWEKEMQDAIKSENAKFASARAQIFRIVMQSWFPDDYRETTRLEHTGADGGPIKTLTADAARDELVELLKDPTVRAALGVNVSLPEIPDRRH